MKFFDRVQDWFARQQIHPSVQEPIGSGLTPAGLPRRPSAPRPVDKSKVDPGWQAPRDLPQPKLLRVIEPTTEHGPYYGIFLYNNQQHTFMLDRDDMSPTGHSNECCQLGRDEPYPCGCQHIFGSGGTSPECDEYKRLKRIEDDYWRNRPTAQDPEEQEAIYAEAERLKIETFRHTCVCGAFDRPVRPSSQYTASGLRIGYPLAVLRSHPNHPGTLPEKLEGRWVDSNPAWPEWSIDSYLGRWASGCYADWDGASKDRYEERDGLKGVVVYVKPGNAPTRPSLSIEAPPGMVFRNGVLVSKTDQAVSAPI